MSENTETAIFAGGCSGPRRNCCVTATRSSPPVPATRAGENDNLTAGHHPGHAEAVQVTFDSGRPSYRNILEFFFQIHRARPRRRGCRLRLPLRDLLYQRRAGPDRQDTIAGASGFWGAKVTTKISQAGPFWEAEAEDQDYFQRYPAGPGSRRHLSPKARAARTPASEPSQPAAPVIRQGD
jgi:peptide-methionine (S)-S-oxide reductase